ncbi:alpha-2-macroglobulin family protein [Myroides sp. LJL119]
MRFFKLCITIFTLIYLLTGCDKSKPKDFQVSNPQDFKEYIVSFTSGIISAHANIDIALSSNLGNWQANQTLPNKMWKIVPNVPGELIYTESGVIRFIPKHALKQNQTYYMSLNLDKYIDKSELKNSTFNFVATTMPQSITLDIQSLQSIASNTYNLNAKIFTSDLISKSDLLKMVTAMQGKTKLEVQITQNQQTLSKEFNVIISDIQRLDTPSTLEIRIDNTTAGSKQTFSKEVNIPQIDMFQVIDIRKIADDNQNIQINFSDPITKNQDLQGLITLDPALDNLIFTTSGNTVKLYTQVPFTQDILVTLHPGIESVNGQKLHTTYTDSVQFELQKPEVRLIKSGTILPSSTNLKLNFQATTLKAVDVKVYRIYPNNVLQFLQDNNYQTSYNLTKVAKPIAQTTMVLENSSKQGLLKWNSYALDLSTVITPQPGAIYHVEFSFKQEYSLYPCSDSKAEQVPNKTKSKDYYIKYDDQDYYDYYDYTYYDWNQKDNPCDPSYYYYYDFPSTNILASDLGVIVKRANNNIFTVVTNDLITGSVVGAATIEFYDYQQQLLASAKTDSYGLLTINLDKNTPYFIIARNNQSTTYTKIDNATALSVSNFDVDGTTLEQGIQGYTYTERGVYRPGDSIHLGFILDDLANPLPNNHPITVTLTDPFGKVVQESTQKKNNADQYAFTLKTYPEAPTGNYQATINVGGIKFNKTIKVETIKPNRLKITNHQENHLLLSNTKQPVNYSVQWLQGSIAANLQATVDIKYLNQITKFKNFDKYDFNNSLETPANMQQNIFNGKTNSNGDFSFEIKTDLAPKNAGMLKAILTTKVFENAGDMSINVSSIQVSPFDSYVGIKIPQPNKYGYYPTNSNLDFSLALVDQSGIGISGDIEVFLYRKTGYWWWNQNEIGISSYSNSSNHTLIENRLVKANKNGLASYTVNFAEQDWGNYELVALDVNSGHISSKSFYVDYPYWSAKNDQSDNKQATILNIATDKKQYTTDEIVKLSFPSSSGGRALISIEDGIGVLQTFWVSTTDSETNFEFPVTSKMAPNIYINVTLIQPHGSTINNSPIRLYGIVPISVYDAKTKLEPIIKMPEQLKPEQEFTLEVKEKNNQKMSYTIAIVEEGLLDLTNFKTPNPWDKFYSKAALGVRTWDIYDQVIGAYGGTINQIFSIGGDEDLAVGQVKNANRFDPVVVFLGPFTLQAGKTGNHTIKLPKYIGSVKAMVVAANTSERAYGSIEKTVPVKSPLMILGSLPRRAVTGETITLPVTIFSQDPTLKQVSVELKTDHKFKVVGENTKTITGPIQGEKIVYFELKVQDIIGISKIEIQAKSQKHQANYNIELDVLNPNPISTTNHGIVLQPMESQELTWELLGIKNTNHANLTISNFPSINLNSRLNYLIHYPHGCSEQITSAGFPQLFLNAIVNLNESQKQSIQTNVKAALNQLGQRQISNGGFRYWPNSSSADDWTTTYIGHFFLEAEKQGYVLPIGSKQKWIEYQKSQSRQWSFDPKIGNDFNQAYRLYTLALASEPDLAAMNRLRETPRITNNSRIRLAAAYSLISQNDVALSLLNNVELEKDDVSNNYTYGSATRNLAMALDSYLLIQPNSLQTAQLAKELAHQLASNTWMSTQTTAQGLASISHFLKQQPNNKEISIDYNLNGQNKKLKSNQKIEDIDLVSLQQENTLSIKNNSQGVVYINLAKSGILPVGKELSYSENLQINCVFKNQAGQIIDPTNIAQTTQFTAYISITNTSLIPVENLALTQVIPSGWEIVNLRFTQDQTPQDNLVNYTDIKDDRTQFYFNLGAKSTKVFTVELSASYLGHYYLPGIYSNAMYDGNFRARTNGQWVNVVKQE